jgi:hypothetical protein
MSLKVYENKSYKQYQDDLQSEETRERLKKTAAAEAFYQSQRKLLFKRNAFVLLTLILLGTSVVLAIHLWFVLKENAADQSQFFDSAAQPLQVEIISMPRYEEVEVDSLPVWECTDGTFISSETNPGSCQKVTAGANKASRQNKFFNPNSSFGQ